MKRRHLGHGMDVRAGLSAWQRADNTRYGQAMFQVVECSVVSVQR